MKRPVVRSRSKLSRHHRKCRSHGGTNHPTNISVVPQSQHRAFHTVFGNRTPHEIAEYLSNVWIDPTYKLVVVKRRPKMEKG